MMMPDVYPWEPGGTGGGSIPAASVPLAGATAPPWRYPAPQNAQAGFDALISYITTRGTEIWVDKNRVYSGSDHGDGTAVSPFDDLPVAIAYMAAAGKPIYHVHIAPSSTQYSASTIPAGFLFYASCGGAAQVPSLTITGNPGGGIGPLIFSDGFTVAGNMTYVDGMDATAQAVVVFKGIGGVQGNVVYGGAGTLFLVGAGIIEPVTGVQSINFTGNVDVGPLGYFIHHSADVQGSVNCAYHAAVDSKQKGTITCAGSFIKIAEAEGDDTFPYGAPSVTFTGPPGVVSVDGTTYRAFALANGTVTNGVVENGGPRPARIQCWDSAPYGFGASDQYWYTFSSLYSGVPPLTNDATEATRQPVLPTAVARMFTVNLWATLLAGEGFKVRVLGCAHDPQSGTLLRNEPLYQLDVPIELEFTDGDTGSKRLVDMATKLTVNGGTPVTHIVYQYHQVGASIYQERLSPVLDVE